MAPVWRQDAPAYEFVPGYGTETCVYQGYTEAPCDCGGAVEWALDCHCPPPNEPESVTVLHPYQCGQQWAPAAACQPPPDDLLWVCCCGGVHEDDARSGYPGYDAGTTAPGGSTVHGPDNVRGFYVDQGSGGGGNIQHPFIRDEREALSAVKSAILGAPNSSNNDTAGTGTPLSTDSSRRPTLEEIGALSVISRSAAGRPTGASTSSRQPTESDRDASATVPGAMQRRSAEWGGRDGQEARSRTPTHEEAVNVLSNAIRRPPVTSDNTRLSNVYFANFGRTPQSYITTRAIVDRDYPFPITSRSNFLRHYPLPLPNARPTISIDSRQDQSGRSVIPIARVPSGGRPNATTGESYNLTGKTAVQLSSTALQGRPITAAGDKQGQRERFGIPLSSTPSKGRQIAGVGDQGRRGMHHQAASDRTVTNLHVATDSQQDRSGRSVIPASAKTSEKRRKPSPGGKQGRSDRCDPLCSKAVVVRQAIVTDDKEGRRKRSPLCPTPSQGRQAVAPCVRRGRIGVCTSSAEVRQITVTRNKPTRSGRSIIPLSPTPSEEQQSTAAADRSSPDQSERSEGHQISTSESRSRESVLQSEGGRIKRAKSPPGEKLEVDKGKGARRSAATPERASPRSTRGSQMPPRRPSTRERNALSVIVASLKGRPRSSEHGDDEPEAHAAATSRLSRRPTAEERRALSVIKAAIEADRSSSRPSTSQNQRSTRPMSTKSSVRTARERLRVMSSGRDGKPSVFVIQPSPDQRRPSTVKEIARPVSSNDSDHSVRSVLSSPGLVKSDMSVKGGAAASLRPTLEQRALNVISSAIGSAPASSARSRTGMASNAAGGAKRASRCPTMQELRALSVVTAALEARSLPDALSDASIEGSCSSQCEGLAQGRQLTREQTHALSVLEAAVERGPVSCAEAARSEESRRQRRALSVLTACVLGVPLAAVDPDMADEDAPARHATEEEELALAVIEAALQKTARDADAEEEDASESSASCGCAPAACAWWFPHAACYSVCAPSAAGGCCRCGGAARQASCAKCSCGQCGGGAKCQCSCERKSPSAGSCRCRRCAEVSGEAQAAQPAARAAPTAASAAASHCSEAADAAWAACAPRAPRCAAPRPAACGCCALWPRPRAADGCCEAAAARECACRCCQRKPKKTDQNGGDRAVPREPKGGGGKKKRREEREGVAEEGEEGAKAQRRVAPDFHRQSRQRYRHDESEAWPAGACGRACCRRGRRRSRRSSRSRSCGAAAATAAAAAAEAAADAASAALREHRCCACACPRRCCAD